MSKNCPVLDFLKSAFRTPQDRGDGDIYEYRLLLSGCAYNGDLEGGHTKSALGGLLLDDPVSLWKVGESYDEYPQELALWIRVAPVTKTVGNLQFTGPPHEAIANYLAAILTLFLRRLVGRLWLAVTAAALVFVLGTEANAQSPPFAWAKRIASTANPDFEPSQCLAIDTAGNLYVTGWFDGTNDFGNGVVLTNSPGGGQDVFVAKYNSAGTVQWARKAGGSTSGRDGGRGIGLDNAGNVYVTGEYYGDADFDGNLLPGWQLSRFFLAKYDNDGAIRWVRGSVGGQSVYGTGLAVDGDGNAYATGYADNGGYIQFGTNLVASQTFSGYSMFFVKYDRVGTATWAQLLDSPLEAYGTSVAVHGSNQVYVAGSFTTSLDIGTFHFEGTGGEDGFVARFNAAGNLQWARQMTRSGDSTVLGSLSVDGGGNVLVAGGFSSYFGGTICFDTSMCLTSAGGGHFSGANGDAFLAKYGANGTPLWAERSGGTNADAFTGVATDSDGNIFVAGATDGIVGPGGYSAFKALVAKYDAGGFLQWTQTFAGTNALAYSGPVLDSVGNCYFGGWFQSNVVLGTNTITGNGSWNFFLAKSGTATLPLSLGIQWEYPEAVLTVTGEIGTRFVMEYTPALPATSWQPLSTNTLTSSSLTVVDENSEGVPSARFYRARAVP